ncbi:hypothetical protein TBLA_0B06930 [Henningerozyma blattae CBS 6284]|uniref:Phosphatidylinositol N-acetylglucosaminyltransferase subunit H conserved domain-containing protein n=1 Tax=Henningerozyma blattae (strain ATCC 34711 / CBS 6284 / DSM 70876 / NBRC 10599 / NRRL Y-10934 / UCD 77-7) TaxID=1071380 RepID=I2GZG2_HENB6|nr:hypothetical protein TBLA_0B06930 [Tetrapisispora blattae CBS 6284]CCH59514.1 hypothetical protein TBLA_0B06930 [Tetrapisispora blattae CBS 6284]
MRNIKTNALIRDAITKEKYQLLIKRTKDGKYMKCTAIPAHYSMLKYIKLLIICLAIALVRYLMFAMFSEDYISLKIPLLPILLFIFSLFIIRSPSISSITIIHGYGIQISTTCGLLIFPDVWNHKLFQQSDFIPRDVIVDIVINEGFNRSFQVIFYLAIITKNNGKLTLLFPLSMNIRLDDQRMLYNLSRKTLFDPHDGLFSLANYQRDRFSS